MAPWLLWFLPSFEAGFWSALLAGKLRNRGKIREPACLWKTCADLSAGH